LPAIAQELEAELFFNNDPGFGNGIAFDPQSNESVDMIIAQAAEMLEHGKHSVFVRITENGKWSHYGFAGFVIVQESFHASLVAGEYFFNSESGAGEGNILSMDASDAIDLELTANTAGLTQGRHYLHFRVGNGSVWSHYRQMSFMVNSSESIPINGAEFFINEDPGQGAATVSAIEAGNEIDFMLDLSPESLEPGRQFLHFRVRNGHLWSHYTQFPFTVTRSDESIAPLASLQFFINESEEEAHNWTTELLIESADSIDDDFSFSAHGLPAGVNELYLKINDSNNYMSHYIPVEFVVCESIHPVLETDGTLLTCLTDETPDAWQWLLNGDTIPGATGATFTALQSGTYSVFVYYNGNCFEESAPIEVTVIEECEPINVSIEATGNILLALTDFQPEAFQWLLNGDTIPDATLAEYVALENGVYSVVVFYENDCVEVSADYEFIIETNTSGSFVFNTRPQFPFGNSSGAFGFNTSPLQSIWAYSDFFLFDTQFNTYKVELNVSPPESGNASGAGSYIPLWKVNVAFRPASGYLFLHWADQRGNVISKENPYSFSMPAEDITMIAHAQKITSVGDIEIADLTIFPNPASDYFKIESEQIIKVVAIHDIKGGILYRDEPNVNDIRIKTDQLVNGVYIIKIETSLGSYNRKVIIDGNIR
jgi:hypothetical protein